MVSFASRVCRVEKTRWPVSAAVSAMSMVSQVAHFAHQDDVRVLPECRPQRQGEGIRIRADLALVDDGFPVLVEELDGVLDGDHVAVPVGVDVVDHGCQRRGFTGTGGAGDQDQAFPFLADLLEDLRQVQLIQGGRVRGHDPEDHAVAAPLLEAVDPEPGHGAQAVGKVNLVGGLEFRLLIFVQKAVGHIVDVFITELLIIAHRDQRTEPPDYRGKADLDVNVGCRHFHCAFENRVNVHSLFHSCGLFQLLNGNETVPEGTIDLLEGIRDDPADTPWPPLFPGPAAVCCRYTMILPFR